MTRSPWLGIPLSDYEAHMALPEVAQAQLLSDEFESLLRRFRPHSVAVIGCAGGNGFDRIDPAVTARVVGNGTIATNLILGAVTARVVGIDFNADYIAVANERYRSRIPGLELIACDIETNPLPVVPVDFVYAALVLEYVDVQRVLEGLRTLIVPGGILATVVQLAKSLEYKGTTAAR